MLLNEDLECTIYKAVDGGSFPLADKKCIAEDPDIEEVKAGHKVRCWHYKKLKELKQKLEDV